MSSAPLGRVWSSMAGALFGPEAINPKDYYPWPIFVTALKAIVSTLWNAWSKTWKRQRRNCASGAEKLKADYDGECSDSACKID